MPSSPGKPQPDYSDSFKAIAIAKLFLAGYPDFPGALRKVSMELGVSHQTLSRWAKGIGTAIQPSLVNAALDAMETSINDELDKILKTMDKKRDDAHFRELALAFGILFDKAQILRGAPTRRTEMRHLVSDLREKTNEDLERIIADAEERARREVIDVTPRAPDPEGTSGDGPPHPGTATDPGLHQLYLPEVSGGSIPRSDSSGS